MTAGAEDLGGRLPLLDPATLMDSVDLVTLAGCYELIRSLLNAFEIPVPQSAS